MMDNKPPRDILNVSSPNEETYPEENLPKKGARPTVSPQEGGYFLNKFLDQSGKPASETSLEEAINTAGSDTSSTHADSTVPESPEALQASVVAALQEIYDPEIPVNIYELGLIYDVDVAEDFSVHIRMTLTTPHCPVAESMPGEVELKARSVPGVTSAEVALVWEPAWDMNMMSDEARLELGLL